MVRAFEVSVDLRAEKAVRERVVWVARDPRRPSAFNGDERRTCVGAVVRTATTHDVGIALSESNSAHGRGRSGNRTAIEARSKRYRAGRRRATPSGAAPNTFDVMDLHPRPRRRERRYFPTGRATESRAASSPAGRTLHAGASVGGKTLLSLHLDNICRS